MSVQHYKNGQLSIIAGAGGIGGGGGECDCENKTFTGTTAEVEQAIADGVIKDDYIVNITDDVTAGAADIDVLDTYDEIMANTEEGKAAGALGVKEGFEEIANSLDDLTNNIQTVDDKVTQVANRTFNSYSCKNYCWTDGNTYVQKYGCLVIVNFSFYNSSNMVVNTTYKISDLPYNPSIGTKTSGVVAGITNTNAEISTLNKSIVLIPRGGDLPGNTWISGHLVYITND